ncbi:probable E3 ubiquitin-protein ligase RZFP34 [Andrographis paniculata]|uniref:probable E3 ubiquitin-protein ligase RZFP34 n=1 Tax=Andrographis paniculata TaxID=175694 RepID=UPI0021E81689|nr:probable E3 ubiquitin-protein ligase RZFP34 [Andrographis paniculata]XP_051129665.1 probable E3 ubiquitin-protein ligase RZFP34 [Andrographis paniculata]XP_051129667.1 probable E3 ubiquitin-protein ligase RZFP34 [Andrographis paniculata]
MACVAADYCGTPPHMEANTSTFEENDMERRIKACESELQQLTLKEDTVESEIPCHEEMSDADILDKGYLEYGCSHYRRRCRIRAPCCNEIFDCRHCHNEAKNNICVDQRLRHDLPRHSVEKVVCSLCNTEQEVRQVCKNCGVCMAKYFCGICKLFDDDTSKQQYHCHGCGICRIGGSKNFFHCNKCGCCYSALLTSGHPCVERAMHQNCPVCFEYLFESVNDVIALLCGHTIHKTCLEEMQEHYQYACPICSKSVCDMSKVWEKFDMEIAATPMPSFCENRMVWILCNDCGRNSEVKYHVVAHKCPECKSYNTRQIR